MNLPLRSRLAPTPSGYLHLGNLANFLLTEYIVRGEGGVLRLRIDDCDASRVRPEFVANIFETLRWAGIDWQEGPRDPSDFEQNFSQAKRRNYYFQRLEALRPHLYACACSRKESGAIYPGTCREKGLPFEAGTTALRLRLDEPALREAFGDVVLWRKDGGPAYQWASVIDDLDQRISLIVRGEDLRASTHLQKHIAALVTPGGFAEVRFLHHPLLLGENHEKLSKSQRATPVLKAKNQGPASAAALRAELEPWIEQCAKLKD